MDRAEIDALKQALEGDPQFADGHFFLAKAYLASGSNLDEAVRRYLAWDSILDEKLTLNLDPQQKKLVEEQYKDFVRGGANLDTVRQGTLRSLNKQINMAQLTFGQNLLAETNAFKLVLDKQEDLAGLPAGLIAVAAETANADTATKGKWVFTLQNPSVIPFLQSVMGG